MLDYKKSFIEFAVQQNVLKFGTFTLKSGRTSPYFFNAGEFKTGPALSRLAEYYAACYNENIKKDDNTVLFGPAYKGIPLVAITAVKLADLHNINLPIAYNRKEAKDHGEGGNIVGTLLNETSNIVIIEDVITAGTAIAETKTLLQANGNPKIQSVIIAIDRCEAQAEGDTETSLQKIARENKIEIHSIINIHEILEHLYNREINGKIYITSAEKSAIETYLSKYGA